MTDRIRFLLNRIRERLWVRPLAFCILSVAAAFIAKTADNTNLGAIVPDINSESIEALLTVISSSMLVIATFAVASMVSAYAATSSTATPRAFSLVVSDDVSQNALSTFIGAFIFSIVALVALKNGYYQKAGHFALFSLTVFIFAVVILTFVRWVDRIARLGRLGTTIDRVEKAAAAALQRRRRARTLGGAPVTDRQNRGQAVYAGSIGYVQRIDVIALQACAEAHGMRITVAALPGAFAAPGQAIAYVTSDSGDLSDTDIQELQGAFVIGDDRVFDDDPRFGIIVLSEIAGRALSPAVNDPGTAIDIVGTFVRLFSMWSEHDKQEENAPKYDRVHVPEISLEDMFDDAFTSIARDGAGAVEVAVRLQKAFQSLASLGDPALRIVATDHARLALARAEYAMAHAQDLQHLRQAATLAGVEGGQIDR